MTAMERRRKGETRAQPRTGSSRRQFSPGNAIDCAPACQSEHRASATRDHTQPANPALRRIVATAPNRWVGSGGRTCTVHHECLGGTAADHWLEFRGVRGSAGPESGSPSVDDAMSSEMYSLNGGHTSRACPPSDIKPQ